MHDKFQYGLCTTPGMCKTILLSRIDLKTSVLEWSEKKNVTKMAWLWGVALFGGLATPSNLPGGSKITPKCHNSQTTHCRLGF